MTTLARQLLAHGLSSEQIEKITYLLTHRTKNSSPEQCWQPILKIILTEKYSFEIFALLYKTVYPDADNTPAPAWFPDEKLIETTNLAKLMLEKNISNYSDFHRWSVTQYADFWQTMIKKLNIVFDKPYSSIVNLSAGIQSPTWFPDAQFNIINSCFQADATKNAIIAQDEQGQVTTTSYHALRQLSNRIANSLQKKFRVSDSIAIIMPMTTEAIAIYLAIIQSGFCVVAIPDSFSIEEISLRLHIAQAKAVFCQDKIMRDGKSIALYERVRQASSLLHIVVPAEKNLSIELSAPDMAWENFLEKNTVFQAIACHPEDCINILFSSGTTGEPKAIPWNHTSPIKCGSDAYLHHNIQSDDIFCWPTNLGWMMGPWLIFAVLLNQATLAIYTGTPNGKKFGEFVQDNKITLLGVVPTIVRTWRHSQCMQGLDWQSIKLFTSTGERSNVEDMLYLMSLAYYPPVIEYCGGTEISGAYITSTIVQPIAPAAFTTPAAGLDFILIDEQGNPTDKGEVAIIPPSIGLSTTLLNKDHQKIYYTGMPTVPGKTLRRHGDQLQQFSNGYYRLLGRVDDTMKLGGIKISSAEIENLLNKLPAVDETAAIAIQSDNGGPSLLVIYVVLTTQKNHNAQTIKADMQKMIKENLNPLFKIHDVIVIDALPRTASNKVMRRVLKDMYCERP